MKTLQVRVKPNARFAALEEQPDGTWVARVKAPPTEGKANRELVALIAEHFSLPKSRVRIRHGAGGRLKRIEMED